MEENAIATRTCVVVVGVVVVVVVVVSSREMRSNTVL